jgi:hypothetical protein
MTDHVVLARDHRPLSVQLKTLIFRARSPYYYRNQFPSADEAIVAPNRHNRYAQPMRILAAHLAND